MRALALSRWRRWRFPLYYGHLFNNSKDIPFAALFTWALYATVASAGNCHACPKRAAAAAIAIGLTLAVRVGGVFVLGYLGLMWLAVLGQQWRRGVQLTAADLTRAAATMMAVCLAAWALMLAFWPWGQVAPISHPLEAIRVAAHFEFDRPQLFLGQYITPAPPPLSYIPVWFSIVLPEFHFLAWMAGAAVLVSAWRSPRKRRMPAALEGDGKNPVDRLSERRLWISQPLEVGFVAFAAFLLPATVALLRSTVYDGVRQLIFVLPPLCALTGIALSAWIDNRHVSRWLKAGLLLPAALSAVATLAELVRLHPYESIYFNHMVGGLRGAASRFDTDYWGLSTRGDGMGHASHATVASPPGGGKLLVSILERVFPGQGSRGNEVAATCDGPGAA